MLSLQERLKGDFLVLHFSSIFFIGLILVLLLSTSKVYSAQVELSWDANIEDDLAGYKLYYGTSSANNNYDKSDDVGNTTNHTVSGLTDGETYFFAVTAYDTSFNESGFSLGASYTVPNTAATTTTTVPNTAVTTTTTTTTLPDDTIPPSDDCTLEFKFQKTTLQNGMAYYTDRAYTMTGVPSQYIGLEIIITPNDDRKNTCGSDYVKFAKASTGLVYVAYDQRAKTLPDWMDGFTDTGDIINTSLDSQGWLKIYSKQFSADECVNLGCNKGPGFSGSIVSNYCVFYGDSAGGCSLDSKFQHTTLQNGMVYYTDRAYTLTSVPSQYIGLEIIITPNDDRKNTCGSDYVKFAKASTGLVYVAYDQRAKTLPDWMDGFTDTGDIINTSLDSQGWLKIYSKQFSADECVNLGCNKGPGFSGSIVSNYIVFTD